VTEPIELDPEEEARYGSAVEDAFIQERGTPFTFAAKDWQLLRSWMVRGIPADTVIRAVREVFEKRRARGVVGKVNFLEYCADAVEVRWELERRGLVGSLDPSAVAAAAVAARLEQLVMALAAAAERPREGADPKATRRALEKTIAGLKELDRGRGFDQLEEDLSKLEASLAGKLHKALQPEAAAELDRRVAELLGETSAMAPAAAERTRKALERREVRHRFELPPLTLFEV
jgi:hypothetical protein